MEQTIKIAIDGPAGAGKTTVAQELASQFQFLYVDTGALYRAIALKAARLGVDINDEVAVGEMLQNTDLRLKHEKNQQQVILDDEDVSEELRAPEISSAASTISAMPIVRKKLIDIQQNLAKENNVIMEGRDIGTVVLPHAEVKIFLTATTDDRASRRLRQLQKKGVITTFDRVKREIKQRDFQDSSRAVAPLMMAKDGIIVDSSDYNFKETVFIIREIIREKLIFLKNEKEETV